MPQQHGRIVLLRPLKERELLIKTFVRLGVEVVIADEIGSDLIGFADHEIPLCSVPAAAKLGQLGELEDAVCSFHATYPIDGVITALDYLLPSVGRINERLGLRGLSESAAMACFDKRLQRLAFKRHNVPSTDFRIVTSLAEANAAADELGYPLVLKPTDRTGSRGVVRVDDNSQLAKAFATTAAEAWSTTYLVERYLVGSELSVETVTHGDRTSLVSVTKKWLGEEPDFVEVGHIVPGGFPVEIEREAFAVTESALRALGVRDTVCHTELKHTEDGFHILEVNGRAIGGCAADMLLDATGMNLYEAQWDDIRGKEPTILRTPRHHLACKAIVDGLGRLTSVDLGKLRHRDPREFKRVQIFVAPGTVLGPVHHTNDVRGWVMGRGPDPETASCRADALLNEIHLVCGTDGEPS